MRDWNSKPRHSTSPHLIELIDKSNKEYFENASKAHTRSKGDGLIWHTPKVYPWRLSKQCSKEAIFLGLERSNHSYSKELPY